MSAVVRPSVPILYKYMYVLKYMVSHILKKEIIGNTACTRGGAPV